MKPDDDAEGTEKEDPHPDEHKPVTSEDDTVPQGDVSR